MEIWVGRDAERFAFKAETFLSARIERNVLATVLAGVRSGRYAEALFAVLHDGHGETAGVALRTPPHHILAAGAIDDPDAFIAAWLGIDPTPSGVAAEPALARVLAQAWSRHGAGATESRAHEALHVLERVAPVGRNVPGSLRLAGWRDTAQLREWGTAFAVDAGRPHPSDIATGVEHALEQGRLYVWVLDGQSVAMVGHVATVAGTARVGPVYTPSALRGRGYGTAATAAVSQRLLDAGAERCMLYTDLANPVSNHIYAKIGYVRIGDWEEIAFRPLIGHWCDG